MDMKYKCKFCGTRTDDRRELCHYCRDKYKILKESGLFGGKAKKRKKKARWEWTDTRFRETGIETQSLVDFVNQSGTIHYGRYVAQQQMK